MTCTCSQSVVPPPPPLPPPPELGDPSEVRPFMDPYGRAKTVRIGKWRWPPPKDDSDTSFLQFKLKQRRKHSQVLLINKTSNPIIRLHKDVYFVKELDLCL